MKRYLLLAAAATAALGPAVSQAVVVAQAITPRLSGETNVTSFSITSPQPALVAPSGRFVDFTTGGRNFGYATRFSDSEAVGTIESGSTVGFAVLDDSAGSFAGDTNGIIKDLDDANFFSVVDTVNTDNSNTANAADTFYSATWTFNTSSGVGGLSISADVAAMGDFELPNGGDTYTWEYSVNGGAFQPLFVQGWEDTSFVNIANTSIIDQTVAGQDASQLPPQVVYQLESGVFIALNDPELLDGRYLDNNFQTFTKTIGAASTVAVRFTASTDGTAEAYAFRNITITDGAPVGLVGDYNGDGQVSAADYTVWRDTLGSTTDLRADGDNSGSITQADYTVWANNYGSASSAVAVPEPAAAALAAAALAVFARRRAG